jgi:hypothetical protein
MIYHFLEGVKKTNAFCSDEENQLKVMKSLGEHHGLPVGWACNDDQINECEKQQFRPTINGRVQTLIKEGPNKGRFLLDAARAWGKGFVSQLEEKVESFWGDVLILAIDGVDGTIVY